MFPQLRNRVKESATCDAADDGIDIKYSFWISFAEIYNENIYDLLEKLPEPKRKGDKPRRIPMKLAEEKGGAGLVTYSIHYYHN